MNGDIKQREDEADTAYLVRLAQRAIGERKSIKSNVERLNDRLEYHKDQIEENKEICNKNSTWLNVLVSSAAVIGIASAGVLIEGALANKKTQMTKTPSKKTLRIITKIQGMEYDALTKKIRSGEYDAYLNRIESWELDNKNRTSVLRAIAERKREIRRH